MTRNLKRNLEDRIFSHRTSIGVSVAFSAFLSLAVGSVASAQVHRPIRQARSTARQRLIVPQRWAQPGAPIESPRLAGQRPDETRLEENRPAAADPMLAQAATPPEPRSAAQPPRLKPAPQRQPSVAAAPVPSHTAPIQPPRATPTPIRPLQSEQHLSDWMDAHRSMSLEEQHRALDSERGFRDQTPQEQQRLHQLLNRLNAMPPAQRQKFIERTEIMARLQPAQRQQVRNAMGQLGNLPEDRQHAVSRAFFLLRDIPAPQREAYMNSQRFRNQFNDQERDAINGLLGIVPIWPPFQTATVR